MTLTVPSSRGSFTRGLTTPEAGVEAGRAARPVFDEPEDGSVIQAFGDQLTQVGDRIEADRLQNEMGRLELNVTQDLYALRQEAEGIADPDELDEFWSSRVGTLREEYLQGTSENGRPRVHPKLRDRWSLGFDDMAWRHAASLGIGSGIRRAGRKIAGFAEFQAEAGRQAAATDPLTRDLLYERFDARVDDLTASGLLDERNAAVQKQAFRETAEAGNIAALIVEDPETVLEGLDRGEWSSLDPKVRAAWRGKAEAAVTAQGAEAARASAATMRQGEARIRSDLEGLPTALAGGAVSPAEGLLADPAVAEKFPAEVSRARGAVALRDAGVALRQMSPPDLEELAGRIGRGEVASAASKEALGIVGERLDAVRRALDRDPVGFARSAGLPVPEIDLSSPEALLAGLADRAAFADWMVENGYGAAPVYLTLDERREAGRALQATPELKASIAQGIAARFGDGADGIMTELGIDPMTRKIALGGGDAGLAPSAERGLAARDAGDAATVGEFLTHVSLAPQPDREATAAALGDFSPNLSAAVLLAPEDASLARRVALGGLTEGAGRDFTHVGQIAGAQAEGFARALDAAGIPSADIEALRRFGSPQVRAAVDPVLSDDEANARLLESGLPPEGLRRLWREAGPGPLLSPETPADRVADRIGADPMARRLADAERYTGDSPEAAADFEGVLKRIDALPAPERDAAVKRHIDEAGARHRAKLGRPLFYGSGTITMVGLKEAARRVVQAHRDGRIDLAAYEAQAVLIRDLAETFDE